MVPQVAGLYSKYKDQGFHVVGLECQGSTEAAILASVKKLDASFQITMNGELKGSKVRGIPHGFLFGADGKLIADDPSHGRLEALVKAALQDVPVQVAQGAKNAESAGPKAEAPASRPVAIAELPSAPGVHAGASPEALATWDEKLKARVKADVEAKRRTEFLLASMKMQVAIAALDDKGVMQLLSQGLEVPSNWGKLTLEEKRNLAVAFAKTGEQPDLLLAVFFCLTLGAEDQAEKYIQRVTQADELKEVLAVFNKHL